MNNKCEKQNRIAILLISFMPLIMTVVSVMLKESSYSVSELELVHRI